MSEEKIYPPLSPFYVGLMSRCPRCGKGSLFEGFLKIAKSCPNCQLDYHFADSGDGPAVFIILIVGFIVIGLALYTEITYQPSYWLHAALWLPLIVVLSLGLLRPAKALLVALQYHYRVK